MVLKKKIQIEATMCAQHCGGQGEKNMYNVKEPKKSQHSWSPDDEEEHADAEKVWRGHG